MPPDVIEPQNHQNAPTEPTPSEPNAEPMPAQTPPLPATPVNPPLQASPGLGTSSAPNSVLAGSVFSPTVSGPVVGSGGTPDTPGFAPQQGFVSGDSTPPSQPTFGQNSQQPKRSKKRL
ncbi:MAG TPA: hypothetical protein VGG13_01275 [Candidatus Saccharimonadales bacterium]|jgi:hypothetical protein